MLTRQGSYLNYGVKLGNSSHIILDVEAAACLSHQPLNFIWLSQMTLGFSLFFVTGVGLQLEIARQHIMSSVYITIKAKTDLKPGQSE